jgi:Arc/MetJ-type ribon-helix-helix transcriptional regulator
MSGDITIGLDYSHNNMLTLEASSYADFTQFLFASGYKLGKIEAGFASAVKLKDYNAIIISTPKNINLTPQELENLEQYVKNGGCLLLISTRGGDYINRTNLNSLTRNFGFEFTIDDISDSVKFVNLQKRPILEDFKPHYITDQIRKLVLSSACSLKTLDFTGNHNKRSVEVLVRGGLNCWHKIFVDDKWIEEDSPKIPLVVTAEYYKGKVVAFGSLSIFSSLGREYGFSAFDNDIFIANVLRWLTLDISSEGKVITIDLQRSLFHWASSIIKEDNWINFSDIINVSLKYFKDNYKDIMEEFKEQQKERIELRETEELDQKIDDEVLELIPKRKKGDLKDIIQAIEEVSGEKYEISIDLEDDEESLESGEIREEILKNLPENLSDLTVKELKEFANRNEIRLPKQARKADIIRIIRYVLGLDD